MSTGPSRLYSWSRFAARTLAAAVEADAPPSKLMFVVTKRCHSRCVYCDIWKAKDAPGGLDGELGLDEIRRFAAANAYWHWIDFTGGEPTDRPDFVDVVRAFSETSPHLLLVHFPTNGLATRRIAAVVDACRDFLRARLVVTVSIDGPPEVNDRLRGVPRDFAHALDTFVEVRRRLGEQNAYVGMTLHGWSGSGGIATPELVERTYEALQAGLAARSEAPLPWSSLHLNIPHFSSHYYGNRARADENGFGGPAHRAEISAALRLAALRSAGQGDLPMRILERIYRAEADRYLASGRNGIPCSALLSTAYLSEQGRVYPCTIWDKPLGNVREHDYRLLPILQAARADGTRRAVREGACPRCWTPCEAYPAIAASPLRAVGAWARGGSHFQS